MHIEKNLLLMKDERKVSATGLNANILERDSIKPRLSLATQRLRTRPIFRTFGGDMCQYAGSKSAQTCDAFMLSFIRSPPCPWRRGLIAISYML
ncbi:hypothetical protein [Mesorhizobium sp.]|uniref:hypothetical protein n=1 Tax=Mesorhizobium sp. TaxID=1871066 RepID=UPI0011FC7E9D|nr:hypothetical protein [Mesorhizobium sp.]TIM39461.1 MAG: hypothetical protein E5Y56_26595 [Mesorhizobium sp.]